MPIQRPSRNMPHAAICCNQIVQFLVYTASLVALLSLLSGLVELVFLGSSLASRSAREYMNAKDLF